MTARTEYDGFYNNRCRVVQTDKGWEAWVDREFIGWKPWTRIKTPRWWGPSPYFKTEQAAEAAATKYLDAVRGRMDGRLI